MLFKVFTLSTFISQGWVKITAPNDPNLNIFYHSKKGSNGILPNSLQYIVSRVISFKNVQIAPNLYYKFFYILHLIPFGIRNQSYFLIVPASESLINHAQFYLGIFFQVPPPQTGVNYACTSMSCQPVLEYSKVDIFCCINM